MSRRTLKAIGAALALVLCAGALHAESHRPAAYRAPRTAYGQPDLQGTWSNLSLTRLERRPGLPLTFPTRTAEVAYAARAAAAWTEAENGGLGQGVSEWHAFYPLARIDGRLRTSWIVAPEDGRLPWRPEARARFLAQGEAAEAGNAAGPEVRTPADRCLMGGGGSAGPPMLNPNNAAGKQIVQTRDAVVILSEMNHDARIVRLGGAHPPKSVRSWMGDSIGRWEGETLVIETTNFHAQEAFRNVFMISPEARITERLTRISPTEIRYDFEVDDPATYTQAWRGEMVFLADKGRIFEYACHEGNYSMQGILAGARHDEAEAARAGQAARAR